jgi:hypothetical protein
MTTIFYECPECGDDAIDAEDAIKCPMVEIDNVCDKNCKVNDPDTCPVLEYDGYCPSCDKYFKDNDYD